MVQPVSHGYPDWQRQVAVADTILGAAETVNTSTSEITERFYVGAFPTIWFQVSSSFGRMRIDMQFFNADTGGVNIDTWQMRVRSTRELSFAVPVIAPFMSLRFSDEIGTGSELSWSAALTQASGVDNGNPEGNIIIQRTGLSVAAGATRTDESEWVWPGRAVCSFDTGATNYRFRLEQINSAGTWVEFIEVANAGRVPPFDVYLPPTPIRASFRNDDAGAQLYRVYLTGDPGIVRR